MLEYKLLFGLDPVKKVPFDVQVMTIAAMLVLKSVWDFSLSLS